MKHTQPENERNAGEHCFLHVCLIRNQIRRNHKRHERPLFLLENRPWAARRIVSKIIFPGAVREPKQLGVSLVFFRPPNCY